MKISELKAFARKETRKKLKHRRKLGFIPAVLYGNNVKPTNIEVEYVSFQKIYKTVGENTLVDVYIDSDKPVKVLVQDVQYDPLTHNFIHIDFYKVNMEKVITTEIPLEFIGESDAIKTQDGILVKNYDELEVECLPGALVEKIEVDISVLKTFDSSIKIKDLKIPAGLKVLDDSDQIVVLVKPPRTEEEMKSLEEKVEENVEKVQVVEKKEKDEESGEKEDSKAKPDKK